MAKMRNFIWVLNNPEWDEVPRPIPSWVRYCIHQKERGDGTPENPEGTVHHQGYMEFNKTQRHSAVKKWLGNGVHLEKMRPGSNRDACRAYARKEGSRIAGPWEVGEWIEMVKKGDVRQVVKRAREGATVEELITDYPEEYTRAQGAVQKARSIYWLEKWKAQFDDIQLREWQLHILEIVKEPVADKRKVHWIFGSKGGEGKTTFLQFLFKNLNAYYVNRGKYEDIAFSYDYEDVILLDFARAIRIDYEMIEYFKNGMIFSPKYTSCLKVRPSPHVVVASNVYPDFTLISQDRILLYDLNKDNK